MLPNPLFQTDIELSQEKPELGMPVNAVYSISGGAVPYASVETWWVIETEYEDLALPNHDHISDVQPQGERQYIPERFSYDNTTMDVYFCVRVTDEEGNIGFAMSDPIRLELEPAERTQILLMLPDEPVTLGEAFTIDYEIVNCNTPLSRMQLSMMEESDQAYIISGDQSFWIDSPGLTGSISLTPKTGDFLWTNIYAEQEDGMQFGEGAQLRAKSNPEISISVTFDRDSMSLGQTLTAQYRIDDPAEMAKMQGVWKAATEYEDISSRKEIVVSYSSGQTSIGAKC